MSYDVISCKHCGRRPDNHAGQDHAFERIEVVQGEGTSLWKNKGWWIFLTIGAAFLAFALIR